MFPTILFFFDLTLNTFPSYGVTGHYKGNQYMNKLRHIPVKDIVEPKVAFTFLQGAEFRGVVVMDDVPINPTKGSRMYTLLGRWAKFYARIDGNYYIVHCLEDTTNLRILNIGDEEVTVRTIKGVFLDKDSTVDHIESYLEFIQNEEMDVDSGETSSSVARIAIGLVEDFFTEFKEINQ